VPAGSPAPETPLVGDGGWLLIASTTTLMLVLSVWLLLA